jgi:hypothetical protein
MPVNITPTTIDYDPQAPVYALPETKSTDTQIGSLSSNDTFIDPKTGTVEGRLPGIIAAEGPLSEAVTAKADQQYNAKGLLNSQGAVQAAQSAVLDNAIKIATPDALAYSNLGQTAQKTQAEGLLNNQLAEIERKKYENNALITGSLTTQDYEGKAQLQKLADTAAIQRLEVDNQWKDLLNQSQYDTQETQALMTSAGEMGKELTGSIERLLRDTNITNKTDAISALMTQYKAQLNTIAAMAGTTLVWS